MMLHLTLAFCALAAVAVCAPQQVADLPGAILDSERHDDQDIVEHDLRKRSPVDQDVDKRAYSYVSEYKRLPVYNFGLGKRSPKFSFGLGKRSEDEVYLDPEEQEILSELVDRYELYDDGLTDQDKRNKMYGFGLGKRTPHYNFGLGKRAYYGMGKRLSPGKFNFGLGKREKNVNRFSFGLGKRSVDEVDVDDGA